MNISAPRVLAFFVAFICVILLPWWLSAFVLFGLTIYFKTYYEVLFFGFLFDILYSPSFSFPYIGLIVATVFLSAVFVVKTQIRT